MAEAIYIFFSTILFGVLKTGSNCLFSVPKSKQLEKFLRIYARILRVRKAGSVYLTHTLRSSSVFDFMTYGGSSHDCYEVTGVRRHTS